MIVLTQAAGELATMIPGGDPAGPGSTMARPAFGPVFLLFVLIVVGIYTLRASRRRRACPGPDDAEPPSEKRPPSN